MKFYIFSGILFVIVFCFQYKKDININNIIENGKSAKVVIIEKSGTCVQSSRNSNYAIVQTRTGIQFHLETNYRQCLENNRMDSLIIRFIDENSNPIILSALNVSLKKISSFSYIFLLIAIAFLIPPLSSKIKAKKE